MSSPGYGILDTGCGKTIIGQETLKHFERLWTERGVALPTPQREINQFRFGNGHLETTEISVPLPVNIGGKNGVIRAAVVKGDAPLLISRPALQSLEATIDLAKNELTLFSDRRTVSLDVNSAGQFLLDVLGPKKDSVVEGSSSQGFNEIMVAEIDTVLPSSETTREVHTPEISSGSESKSVFQEVSPEVQNWSQWIREDWGLSKILIWRSTLEACASSSSCRW